MGIFDSIKSALDKSGKKPDVVVPPSTRLREAGIDPSGLKFSFGTGSIAVSGPVSSEAQRQQILDILKKIEGIDRVQDKLSIASPAPADDTAAGAERNAKGGARTYTVQSGDTLWNISQQMYGKGSAYMRIFEANRDKLESPDRIFPGQELVIPD